MECYFQIFVFNLYFVIIYPYPRFVLLISTRLSKYYSFNLFKGVVIQLVDVSEGLNLTVAEGSSYAERKQLEFFSSSCDSFECPDNQECLLLKKYEFPGYRSLSLFGFFLFSVSFLIATIPTLSRHLIRDSVVPKELVAMVVFAGKTCKLVSSFLLMVI